jgi:hypothetical protein
MGNVAGIIFSLITGSVVGRWIGGILGLPLSVSAPPYLSLFNMPAVLLGAFGVCSTVYISEKWKTLLSRANAGDRPLGVTFVAVICVISGILLSIIMGLLFGYGAEGSILSLVGNALVLVGIFVFVIIMFALYLVIAIGLYRGRMWAWAVTFASTLVGIFSSLNAILNSVFDRLLFDAWLVLKILVLVAWSSNSCLSLAASRKSLFWRGQPRTRHGKREMKRAHKAKLIKAGHIAILKRFVGP